MTDRLTRLYRFPSYDNPDDIIVEAAMDFIRIYDGMAPNLMFASVQTWDKVSENEFLEGMEECDDDCAGDEKGMEPPYKYPRYKNFPELEMCGCIANDFSMSYFIDESLKDDEFMLVWEEVFESERYPAES